MAHIVDLEACNGRMALASKSAPPIDFGCILRSMKPVSEVDWKEIEVLRQRVGGPESASVEIGAKKLVNAFADELNTVVLVRVFLVLPFAALPTDEQQAALAIAGSAPIEGKSRVLCLMATRGSEPAWNDRSRSEGHRAIPLLNRAFVQGIPMIAKLLGELEVDLTALDDGRPIATRKMLGGQNGTFFVPDAGDARDDKGRDIIPGQQFVRQHNVRTVFGMGGAYPDGTLAVAIVFTSELIPRLQIDRFPSLISNFKINTAQAVRARRFF